MRTGVKVDKSPDGDDSRQVQETVGKTSDNERTVPCDNKGGGARKTRANSMLIHESPLQDRDTQHDGQCGAINKWDK